MSSIEIIKRADAVRRKTRNPEVIRLCDDILKIVSRPQNGATNGKAKKKKKRSETDKSAHKTEYMRPYMQEYRMRKRVKELVAEGYSTAQIVEETGLASDIVVEYKETSGRRKKKS